MDLFSLLSGLAGKVGAGLDSLIPTQTFHNDYRKSPQPTQTPIQKIQPQVKATPQPTTRPNLTQQMTNVAAGALGRNPDLPKKAMSPVVLKAIQDAAKEFGVPPHLLFDIGYSEGGFRPDARNETPEGQAVGVPVGLFQFTPGTWNHDLANYAKGSSTSFNNFRSEMPREDPIANARAAAYLISHGQLERWDASKPNWGRFYSEDELKPYYSQSSGYIGR